MPRLPLLVIGTATAALSAAVVAPSADAATINIAFHNGNTTVNAMTSEADGSVVQTSTDTWNNPKNNGTGGQGLSFTGFALNLDDGTASAATLAATSGFASFNNNGWGGNGQDYVMMEGWYGFSGSESVTVSGLPSDFTTNGYTITVYGDVSGGARVMDYTIAGTTLTINDNSAFNGTFTAGNKFVTFTGQTAGSFTVTGNATGSRSAINGIIIQSVPEPASAALLAAGTLLITRRRR